VFDLWARLWRVAVVMAVALLAVEGAGCKRGHTSVAAAPEQMPTVKDDSDAFLLTWIDDKGDFHVETRVADVPMMGRDAVRVVDPGKEDGARGERILVVDLRQSRSDGTYPVRTIARADFDAIALARREKAGPTLANAAPPPPSATTEAFPPGTERSASRGVVVIYGAEWCGACHEAAKYFRRKGIAYVEKDIEKDPTAAREMQQKLARRGLQAGSIPVLDVGGKVMVGFNPSEVEAALGASL
jgi:glutaredoxin